MYGPLHTLTYTFTTSRHIFTIQFKMGVLHSKIFINANITETVHYELRSSQIKRSEKLQMTWRSHLLQSNQSMAQGLPKFTENHDHDSQNTNSSLQDLTHMCTSCQALDQFHISKLKSFNSPNTSRIEIN